MRLIPYLPTSETDSRLWPQTTQFFEEFFNDFPEQARSFRAENVGSRR